MLTYNEMAIARHTYEDVMAVKGRPEIAPVVVEKNVIADMITAFKAAFAPGTTPQPQRIVRRSLATK